MKKLLLASAIKFVVGLAMVSGIAHAAPSSSATAQQGYADRMAWENWFNGLSGGTYRNGAEFWAEHRSDRPQPSCDMVMGGDGSFYQGCAAAHLRLAPMDRRRLSSVQYREGWNGYPEAPVEADITAPAPIAASTPAPAIDPFADVRKLKVIDAGKGNPVAVAPAPTPHVEPVPAPAGGPVSARLLASPDPAPMSQTDAGPVSKPIADAPAPTPAPAPVVAPLPPPIIQSFPTFDIRAHCESQDSSCITYEYDFRSAASGKWERLSPAEKRECVLNSAGSYYTLLSCVDSYASRPRS
jgi:hypothetical protein